MIQQRVRPGTMLFNGAEGPGGVISGQSRLFSARCGVVPYAVTGSHQSNVIVLNEKAPIRGKGCQIVRYRLDNLVFSLLGASEPGPAPAPTPSCPPGYVFAGGACVVAGGTPVPAPGPGDWYAIAGSFGSPGQAQSRVAQLGGGVWRIMNTAQCPNFRNGYWIATAGPFSKAQAQGFAGAASHFGAYVKTCQ